MSLIFFVVYPPPQIVYPDAGEDEDPIQSFPSDGEHSESPLTDVDSEDVERDGTPSIDLEYDSDHSIKADISKGKRAQGKLQERFDFEVSLTKYVAL